MILARLETADGRHLTDVAIPLAIGSPGFIELDGHYFQRHGAIEECGDDGIHVYRETSVASLVTHPWALPRLPN